MSAQDRWCVALYRMKIRASVKNKKNITTIRGMSALKHCFLKTSKLAKRIVRHQIKWSTGWWRQFQKREKLKICRFGKNVAIDLKYAQYTNHDFQWLKKTQKKQKGKSTSQSTKPRRRNSGDFNGDNSPNLEQAAGIWLRSRYHMTQVHTTRKTWSYRMLSSKDAKPHKTESIACAGRNWPALPGCHRF